MVFLEVLKEVVTSNMVLWEEHLLKRCVLSFLFSVEGEADRLVRVQAVQRVAFSATKTTGSHLLDLVEILEKIWRRAT